MSRRLDPVLPEKLFSLLGGHQIDQHLDKVILLVSIDEGGWPYVAMLSLLETVAVDSGNIRIAPWNVSSTTANLRRNPKATLIVVDEEMAYYLQTTASDLAPGLDGFPDMAWINLRIDSILEDKALDYEGSARVSTGIRYENPDMDEAYMERGRRVMAALRH